jgi:hypothetical protein
MSGWGRDGWPAGEEHRHRAITFPREPPTRTGTVADEERKEKKRTGTYHNRWQVGKYLVQK